MKSQQLFRKNDGIIKDWLFSRKENIIFCFCAVFFWGMLAHAYGFLHCSLSHDALNAFTATQVEETWKIELGRFFVPLYRALFRGPVMLPWVIGLLGLVWTAVAVFLVVEIFQIRSRMVVFLTAGIMTTNITYIAQIATYLYEFDFNAFCLMLSVLAVYLWNKNGNIWCVIAGSICLMGSIGIYQAYFAVTVTLIVWKSIMDLFDHADVRAVLVHGLKGILMILLGGILYWLLGKLVYGVTGIQAQDRTDAFAFDGNNPVLFYLGLIKPMIIHLCITILQHSAYGGNWFVMLVGVLAGLFCISAVAVFIIKKYRWDRILLILLLVAVLPFAMDCVYFLARGNDVHDLMVYAAWFFYLFLLLFVFRLCEKDMIPGLLTKILRTVACILVGVILWQNVLLANTAYVKKELEANATLSLMTRVVSALDQREDYVAEETEVAFIGVACNDDALYGMERASAIVGVKRTSALYTDTSAYYYNSYKAYFEYVLQCPVRFCSDEVHAQLSEDDRVQALPAFPQDGYMEMIDGILVIKMG